MQSKSVRFDINIRGTIVRIPGMVERTQFGLVGGNGREQIRFKCLLGQPPDAVHSPDIVVLVIQEAIPALADQRTITQIPELQIRKDHFEHVVRQVADDAAGRLTSCVSRVAPHLPTKKPRCNYFEMRPTETDDFLLLLRTTLPSVEIPCRSTWCSAAPPRAIYKTVRGRIACVVCGKQNGSTPLGYG